MSPRESEPDEALVRAAKHVAREVLDDSDLMKPYWDKQHDHFWNRASTRVTSTVGKWLMAAIVAGAASAVLVYAVQHGWIK
jgi:hypothetical protein